MPTFTTIALENLLEPRVRDSNKKPFHSDPNPRNEGPRHLYISPALYATPEQAPIPDYSPPDPLFPSPYLVNLKRRRGGNETAAISESPSTVKGGSLGLEEVGENFVDESFAGNYDGGEEDEGFLDPRSDAMSEASDLNRSQFESRSFVSATGEFFDAIDDFSSDGSVSNVPSYDSRIESELHSVKLSLLEEIERRKTAEESLVLIRSQWERIRNVMSEAGLTFPAPPSASDSMQIDLDQISQEVVVTRFVAEAIGRGEARAEVEEATAAVIELKDQQISRLRDRLQYYETVNHEMSQRKLVDVARRQQERKRSRRKWLWSFMGLSIAIGASFVAYKGIPKTSDCLSLLKSDDSTDASSIDISEISQE